MAAFFLGMVQGTFLCMVVGVDDAVNILALLVLTVFVVSLFGEAIRHDTSN